MIKIVLEFCAAAILITGTVALIILIVDFVALQVTGNDIGKLLEKKMTRVGPIGPQGPQGMKGDKGDSYILTVEDREQIAKAAANHLSIIKNLFNG